jgi:tetratricopeptide (TPR) repeat protein
VTRFVTICLCILLLVTGALRAEDQFEHRLRLAQQHEKEGHLEAALEIYQDLLVERQGSPELLDSIQRIYREQKRYPELIALLEQRLERNPGDFDLHMIMGQALFLSDQVKMAKETWLKALGLVPKAEESYLRVGKAFWERGMLSEAEEVFLRGRTILKDEALFAETMARLYELSADYQAATHEYLTWLGQDPRRLSYVNSRLAQFPRDDDVSQVVEGVLTLAVAAETDRVEFRSLLGHYLIRAAKPDQAYQHFLVLDGQDKKSNGKVLLNFAQRCAELGHHAAAIKACQEVVVRYPNLATARQAQLAVGHNLATTGQYQQALAAYEEVVSGHPQSSEAAQALFARGEIYFLYMNDLESASEAYRILLSGVGGGARMADAAFRIGDCLVVMGDLEGARIEYQRMAGTQGTEEVREKAAFKLAELSLLEGKFQNSKQGFDELVSSFPQGFYVNDALIKSMFLGDVLSEELEPLKAYIEALRLGVQRQYQQALEVYQKTLQAHPASPLGDDILMQTAFLREKIDQHQEALADLEKLLSDYPHSRLCPEAQRRIGEIYELRLNQLPQAIEAYQKVLSNYPRYLFLDEVRRKVRRLRGEVTS